MPFKVTGGIEMSQKLSKIARQYPDRVAGATYIEAQVEVTEMKKRCPVDITPRAPHPGNLRNSIHAEQPQIRGKYINVIIATGKQAPYAIYVHENPDAIHPVGEWKFMESVLNESQRHMGARIGRRIHFNNWRTF